MSLPQTQNGCHNDRLPVTIRFADAVGDIMLAAPRPALGLLAKFASYYNETRTHVSLGKDAPHGRPVERIGDIVAYPILGELHHRYARIQFSEATGAAGYDFLGMQLRIGWRGGRRRTRTRRSRVPSKLSVARWRCQF